MVRWIYAFAMVIGLAVSSSGQDRSPPPKGPGPQFQLATAAEKDGFVGTGLVQLIGGLFTATIALVVLFYLNWRLTSIILLVLAAFGVFVAQALSGVINRDVQIRHRRCHIGQRGIRSKLLQALVGDISQRKLFTRVGVCQ